MRHFIPGEQLDPMVSISQADVENGSPKAGDMIARNPQDHSDQWLVAKKYFEDNLEEVGTANKDLLFGEAIEVLKAGGKVARAGWNGKGMYLWLLPAAEVKKEWIKDPMLLSVFGDRDTLNCLGSIRMLTATGEVLTGWLASQSDMLAEDWTIV